MTDGIENRFIVCKEVIFTSSSGNEIIKVTCSDESTWFVSTSFGLIGDDIGNELREDSNGNILNERDKLIDINDDRMYCRLSDRTLEEEIKDLLMQDRI